MRNLRNRYWHAERTLKRKKGSQLDTSFTN